ncbi:MAG: three-Cys-motif partner protein TcmP [Thermomicrobiales bacterium]
MVPIMGRSAGYGQEILYIDGFAGRSLYQSSDWISCCCPRAAARQEAKPITMESRDIHCAFVEMDTDRCEYLQNHLMPFQAISGVNYSIACTPFSEGIDELAKQRPEFFTGRLPMFAFIDPFGATGAPFSAGVSASGQSKIGSIHQL